MVFSASASLALSWSSSRLRAGVGFGRLLVAGLVGDGLRAGAGVGQRLFVGRDRLVRLALEPVGFGEIAGDVLLRGPR